MKTISKDRAISIALRWHGGQLSPLYSFISTGKCEGIEKSCIAEMLDTCVASNKTDAKELAKLVRYFEASIKSNKNY